MDDNREQEINDIKAIIRISKLRDDDVFSLYLLSKISLSKLISIIAEDLYDDGYRRSHNEMVNEDNQQ